MQKTPYPVAVKSPYHAHHIQSVVCMGLTIYADHVLEDGSCVEIFIRFILKVSERPILQFERGG